MRQPSYSNISQEALRLIPGGSQLYSKRQDLHAPGVWPTHAKTAKGIQIVDTDGNSYHDYYLMGVGCNVLGYANEEVDKAVHAAIRKGQSCSLNFPEEVELAKLLLTIHPWAEMCKFTRSGGEAMAVAVRIARATTKRHAIAVGIGALAHCCSMTAI